MNRFNLSENLVIPTARMVKIMQTQKKKRNEIEKEERICEDYSNKLRTSGAFTCTFMWQRVHDCKFNDMENCHVMMTN